MNEEGSERPFGQPALAPSAPEPVPVSAHSGNGQAHGLHIAFFRASDGRSLRAVWAFSGNKESKHEHWCLDERRQWQRIFVELFERHHRDRPRRRRALNQPGRRQSGRHGAPGTGYRATKNPKAHTETARGERRIAVTAINPLPLTSPVLE